jgi:hypothetical protein
VTKKQRIRAVLDTNLFISGLFASTATVATLQQLWISRAFELAVSEEILQEIKETLQKPYLQKELSFQPQELDEILGMIREKAFVVTRDRYKTDKITADPDDNKFLGCALEAKAQYVVSGDNHLLSLKHFHGIQVVDAANFVLKMARRVSSLKP